MIKLALLRDKEEPCPYGLEIPMACEKVGKAIHNMKIGQNNAQLFLWEADGNKCPFANKIIKNVVDCSYEGPILNKELTPSPLYEKPFSGSGAMGVNTLPHTYFSGDTPMNKGPYYDMYSIEMVASENKNTK